MIKDYIKKLKINYGKLGLILTAVCVVLLAADLLTKHFEEAYNWNFWHDVDALNWLIYVESGHHNYGAAFSSFTGAKVFLIVLTSIMLVALIAVFLLTPNRFVILKTAIVMIIAGAIGNLVDRVTLGYVRDFVWLNIFGNFACCNFADFWIVLGAIAAAIDVLFLNEFSVFPLTKKARAVQKAQREEELLKKQQKEQAKTIDDDISHNESYIDQKDNDKK